MTDSESQKARDVTSIAIEIVSMWMPAVWRQPKTSALEPEEVQLRRTTRERWLAEDPERVFAGQLNLNMILLERLAIVRGANSATLQDEVAEILQEIAQELPGM